MKIVIKSTDDTNSELKNLKSRLKAHLVDKKSTQPAELVLYVLLPGMETYDLVIDLINDTNTRPEQVTGYLYFEETEKAYFDNHQLKSVKAIGEMVIKNGGVWFRSEDEIVKHLSSTNQYVLE